MNSFRPLLIAVLVVTEVGIWQWRMVVAHRGSRTTAVLLGSIGAILQITAVTQVVADARDPFSIGAYAAGVGVGVLIGLVAGDRLTPGMVGVTITTTSAELARDLWELGWSATAHSGHDWRGPVSVLFVPVKRSDEPRLHDAVRRLAPDASSTTEDLRARVAAVPTG